MPFCCQDRGRRGRPHVGARAGAVGDVDRVGERAQRQRLPEQIVRVARDRRHHLGGEHEARRPQASLEGR